MKMIFLRVVVWLTAIGSLAAQAPGYMGKRFFLQGGSSLMFALERPTAGNKGGLQHFGEGSGTLGFNSRPALQLGFAVSRTKSVTLEAGYIKTGMIVDVSTPSLAYEGYWDEHSLFYHLSGMEYDLSWQTYNPATGALSPLGFFVGFHLKVAPMRGKIVDKLTTYPLSQTATSHAPLGITPRYNHWSAGVEFGRHYILFDRLMLTLSAEFNASPFRYFLNKQGNAPAINDDNQRAFNNEAYARMAGHNKFLVKFSAGYLF